MVYDTSHPCQCIEKELFSPHWRKGWGYRQHRLRRSTGQCTMFTLALQTLLEVLTFLCHLSAAIEESYLLHGHTALRGERCDFYLSYQTWRQRVKWSTGLLPVIQYLSYWIRPYFHLQPFRPWDIPAHFHLQEVFWFSPGPQHTFQFSFWFPKTPLSLFPQYTLFGKNVS